NAHGTLFSRATHDPKAGTPRSLPNSRANANNGATSNGCNEDNENVVVSPRSPSLSTNAGDDKVLGVNGTDLTDTATLSNGTADISGTITFHLYFGADCSPANEVTGRSEERRVGKDGSTYCSPAH